MFDPFISILPSSRLTVSVSGALSAVTFARVLCCSSSRWTGGGQWLVLQRIGVVGNSLFTSGVLPSAVCVSSMMGACSSRGSVSSANGVACGLEASASALVMVVSPYVDHF